MSIFDEEIQDTLTRKKGQLVPYRELFKVLPETYDGLPMYRKRKRITESVKKLKQSGCPITNVPGQGYYWGKLKKPEDSLPEALKELYNALGTRETEAMTFKQIAHRIRGERVPKLSLRNICSNLTVLREWMGDRIGVDRSKKPYRYWRRQNDEIRQA